MKLTFKIVSLIIAVIIIIITFDSLFTIYREIRLYHSDQEEEITLTAVIVTKMLEEIWHISGKTKAILFLQNLNEHGYSTKVSFVENNELDRIKHFYLKNNGSEEERSYLILHDKKEHTLYCYVPFSEGTIEVSQSLVPMIQHIKISIFKIIGISLFCLIAIMFCVLFIGRTVIKKPLDRLALKVNEISRGRLEIKNYISTGDELQNLEQTINNMIENLIQARKETREETEKRYHALNQLEHAERLSTIGRIASGLAHEIGTPINVIQGRAQLIAYEELDANEIKDYSLIIIEETNRITRIIQQLMNYARSQNPEYMLLDIKEVIDLVVTLLSPMAKKSDIILKTSVSDSIEPITLDKTQIQQILMNTIVNAIDAMPDGGEITISAKEVYLHEVSEENQKKYLELSIKDQGIGIPPHLTRKIFQPFYTTKQHNHGTGLGLSIVRNIINDHNGFISVTSEPGNGTTFKFNLPYKGTADDS